MQSAAHAVEPTSKLSRCNASADRWVGVSNRHLRRVTRPPVDSCDPRVYGVRSAVEVATPTPSRVVAIMSFLALRADRDGKNREDLRRPGGAEGDRT